MKATGIVFPRPRSVGLETIDVPEPGPGQVLLKASFSALSPGTEPTCFLEQADSTSPFVLATASRGRWFGLERLSPASARPTTW